MAKRLYKLLERLDGAMGETIPLACADWANTKAAYRFLSNEAVSDSEILAGHFHATAARIQDHPGAGAAGARPSSPAFAHPGQAMRPNAPTNDFFNTIG